jgi:cytochrome c5
MTARTFSRRRRLLRPLNWFLILLPLVWAGIGIAHRTYDFWDSDPNRGALPINDDMFDAPVTAVTYLEQGWDASESLWFYNTTQGSNLLPYDFFLELEQAAGTELFRSNANINRYRYLPQQPTFSNPHGLPLGMSKDTYRGKDYMGYTCAACHTTQLNYNGTGIRIDGGPAMADLESFMGGLAAAMDATLKDPARRERFVAAVLKHGNYTAADAVLQDLEIYTRRLQTYNLINKPRAPDRPLTHYGFARLDAFGRIYNRVLEHIVSADLLEELLTEVVPVAERDKVMANVKPILNASERDHLLARIEQYLTPKQRLALRNKLFNPADAPVSYPFLWDIPQHDYVQWNGIVNNSGIGPMGRNAGQVIGVFGTLDWQQKEGISLSSVLGGQGFGETHVEFNSSVDIRNLRRVENQLHTLTSPAWPATILPAIDPVRAERGRPLFNQYCESCHQTIDRTSADRRVIAHMGNIATVQTDPKMALNSVQFDGHTGILRNYYASMDVGNILLQKEAPAAALLNLSTRNVITTPDPDKIFIQRWAERSFDALSTVFQNKVKPSLKQGDYTPDTTVTPVASLAAYKGRSLNGIWATAPYLHNGSVPSLYELLLPKKRPGDPADGEYRPDEFMVGSREFDPVKVGLRSAGYEGFLFRTHIPGNHNSGHEYASGHTPQADGTVLPALNREQRLDLVEYMKTL